jgi:hypothetical protein
MGKISPARYSYLRWRWLGISFFSQKEYWSAWSAKRLTQQFRDSDELTWSKAFHAVANQRKRASYACYMYQMKSKWKSSALFQEMWLWSVYCVMLWTVHWNPTVTITVAVTNCAVSYSVGCMTSVQRSRQFFCHPVWYCVVKLYLS